MKRGSPTLIAIVALCCGALAPVLLAAAPVEIIALQARVISLRGNTNGTYAPGDGIPANPGDQLRVDLVGTAIVNGTGVERPVNARFNVAAGGQNISLAQVGPNWFVVNINNSAGNGLGQVGFAVTGNYAMKPGNQSGRITFKVGRGGAIGGDGGGAGDSRHARARDLATTLYLAILGTQPAGPQARADIERIDRNGYGGVIDVAVSLARRAESMGRGRAPGERGYEAQDIQTVGTLYRGLLKRQDSSNVMWQNEPGFRDNVRALHERGLASVVQGIVNAQEFIQLYDLRNFPPT